jgi:hypothetical protein
MHHRRDHLHDDGFPAFGRHVPIHPVDGARLVIPNQRHAHPAHGVGAAPVAPLEALALRPQAGAHVVADRPAIARPGQPGVSRRGVVPAVAEIVTELKARVGEGVCQAVVLDYLDKMQPSRAQAKLYGDQIWERQSNDVELLKTFAERHSLPIMTASQGNKGMQQTSGVRTRKDIQGSGAKTQKAQMVAILTREMVGDDGLRDGKGVVLAEPGEYSPFIDVRIDKQNRGKTGVTMRQFLIGQFFDIRDIEIKDGGR